MTSNINTVGMALFSMVRYETHMIYKHCDTCVHLETMFHMKQLLLI